ncbi:MAG: hypothetical protein ACRET5_17210 [Steroidobacteraceae bacterium]
MDTRFHAPQLGKERAHLLAMGGEVAGAQVPVSGHADDDRQPPVGLG